MLALPAAGMEQELKQLRGLAGAIAGTKRKSPDTAQLATQGLLQLLGIKEANKRLCARLEAAKEQTAAAKVAVEASDSTLQNLLYERGYYEKEIRESRSFVSKVPDLEVALMPEPEFRTSLAADPPSSSGEEAEMLSRMAASGDDHEVMKARLIHEHKLRLQLVAQLDQLKSVKASLADNLATQQRTLGDLQVRLHAEHVAVRGCMRMHACSATILRHHSIIQVQLRSLEGAAKPLQLVLAPALPLRTPRAADLLPTPLYVAYSQLMAAREALSVACTVSISGSLEEAEAYARTAMAGASCADAANNSSGAVTGATADPEQLYKVMHVCVARAVVP